MVPETTPDGHRNETSHSGVYFFSKFLLVVLMPVLVFLHISVFVQLVNSVCMANQVKF